MRARRRLLPPRVRVNGGLLPVVTMDDAPIPVVDPRTMFRDCLHCRTSFLSQHGGVRACPVCQAYFNQHGVYPENPQSFACYSGNYSGADDDLLDRKSVVEGKSVSVSVDLGGRRMIKKKKKH